MAYVIVTFSPLADIDLVSCPDGYRLVRKRGWRNHTTIPGLVNRFRHVCRIPLQPFFRLRRRAASKYCFGFNPTMPLKVL